MRFGNRLHSSWKKEKDEKKRIISKYSHACFSASTSLFISLPFYLFTFLLFTGCAKMGQPDGGWYDETPPRILRTSPAERSTNVSGHKVAIFFNEYIKLDNPSEKVVVSPPQMEQAEIKGEGKRILVDLKDSLHSNTTYTIDFSDAISDNNEGNPLGNYTYTFSTGDHIDTLEVGGYVLEAQNLEPIKGILVGLYSNLSDTAFTSLPFLRVGRTDGEGHFVIRGVAPGSYRIYALQDADGNYFFNQKSEKLAFSHDIIVPSFKPDIRPDTVWRDSLHIEGIRRTPYTHFLPDDIVLNAFTEEQTDRYLLKSERKEANHFQLFFSYGDSILPTIRGLNFNAQDAFIVEPTEHADTITYWLRDSALINQDTLRMQIDYRATDSLGQLRPRTDTLDILSRIPFERRQKLQEQQREQWQKKQDKRKKRGQSYETVMPAEMLEPDYHLTADLSPDGYPTLTMPVPLESADTTRIHLYSKIDTLWYRSKVNFKPVANQPRTYAFESTWRPGTQYSLEIDSAAFKDIYGRTSKAYKQGFSVISLDDLGSLQLTITGIDGLQFIAQLLDASEKVVKQVVSKSQDITFLYVKPDAYYVRLIKDDNMNGRWDTGDYSTDRQAEAVYYYPTAIKCRAKWDIKETWNPTLGIRYKQKPREIVKQKPEQEKKIKHQNADRARRMGIEYIPGQTVKQ